MNAYLNTGVNIVSGEIAQRGNDENTTALLDCTKDELESVDFISILQPQLCSRAGTFIYDEIFNSPYFEEYSINLDISILQPKISNSSY